jgi:hypothetical protein
VKDDEEEWKTLKEIMEEEGCNQETIYIHIYSIFSILNSRLRLLFFAKTTKMMICCMQPTTTSSRVRESRLPAPLVLWEKGVYARASFQET